MDSIQDYTREDLRIKNLALNNLFYLTKYVLGYNLLEDIHYGLCSYVQGRFDRAIKSIRGDGQIQVPMDCLILEPRGCFKTTVVSIGFSIYVILNYPNIKITLNHKIMKKSKRILSAIKAHFEKNKILRYYFGDWVGSPWGKEEITVSKRTIISPDPTIAIGGTDHEATGGHSNLHINDDLTGLKDKYSEAERERVLRFYKSHDFLRDLSFWIGEINIGTRKHIEDLSCWIIDNKANPQKHKNPIDVRIRQARLPDGSLYFPSILTEERLRAIEEDDPDEFASEMMNEPRVPGTQVFKHDELTFYDPDNDDISGGVVYGYVDPALSKSKKDCFVAFPIGMELNGFVYLIDYIVERLSPDQAEQKIIEKIIEHNIRKLGIESNAFQTLFAENIKRRIAREGLVCEVVEINHTTDKVLRIKSAHGVLTKKFVYRKDWDEKYPIGMKQLFAFPQGKYVDGPDGLEGLSSMYDFNTDRQWMRFM